MMPLIELAIPRDSRGLGRQGLLALAVGREFVRVCKSDSGQAIVAPTTTSRGAKA